MTVTEKPLAPVIVPDPLILHNGVTPLVVKVYTLPVEPAHTEFGPLRLQVGACWTGRLRKQVDLQPLASVTVSRTVKLEPELTVIVTEEAVLLPFIVPLPETIIHL